MLIDKDVKDKYNSQYSDESEEWRRIGAIGKAQNIIEVAGNIELNSIVDIGAGDGNLLSVLSSNNLGKELTAVEISESAIEQIKKKKINNLKKIVQFDGYNLPFNDNEFDLAVCSHVIEHVEFPRKLLREISRISKHQAFEVPIDFSFNVDKKVKHFTSYGHINIYTPSLFKFLIKTEGYNILNEKYALYDKDVMNFQKKNNLVLNFKTSLKRFIIKSIPALMKFKPNTYTVLTNNSGEKIQIF